MAERDDIEREFTRTLDAVRGSGAQFVFDREGRPGAIAAIRGALPQMERELLDAVIEDCECELAATREAMFRLVEGFKK
ncbi:MAG TPA: hypothetical protein VKC35_05345 [Vicinamibacterales bacterium]|nr:hypothetical protein [Vicinamibacterales bacterium]